MSFRVAGARRHLAALVLTVLALSAPRIAGAVPVYDYFGPLNEATFGGSGIPNTEVAVARQFVDGNVEITIALSATQRYSNPPLTNDGAGTYFAQPGSNTGGAGESSIVAALWNVNLFLRVEGLNGATPKLVDYQFNLYYDFDTGLDTPPASLGSVDLTTAILAFGDPNATLYQGSENLMFSYLATSVPGILIAPPGSFDPNALGEYNFAITVSRPGFFPLETVAMDVQVVPEPGTALLLTLGLAGLGRAAGVRRPKA